MCWGHEDALERNNIKCFVSIMSYYITPWSWQGLAWGCHGHCGSQHPGGVALSIPWSSWCPMGPCRGVSWGDFGHHSPGSVQLWVLVGFF